MKAIQGSREKTEDAAELAGISQEDPIGVVRTAIIHLPVRVSARAGTRIPMETHHRVAATVRVDRQAIAAGRKAGASTPRTLMHRVSIGAMTVTNVISVTHVNSNMAVRVARVAMVVVVSAGTAEMQVAAALATTGVMGTDATMAIVVASVGMENQVNAAAITVSAASAMTDAAMISAVMAIVVASRGVAIQANAIRETVDSIAATEETTVAATQTVAAATPTVVSLTDVNLPARAVRVASVAASARTMAMMTAAAIAARIVAVSVAATATVIPSTVILNTAASIGVVTIVTAAAATAIVASTVMTVMIVMTAISTVPTAMAIAVMTVEAMIVMTTTTAMIATIVMTVEAMTALIAMTIMAAISNIVILTEEPGAAASTVMEGVSTAEAPIMPIVATSMAMTCHVAIPMARSASHRRTRIRIVVRTSHACRAAWNGRCFPRTRRSICEV
ncbi:hypothetical protein [Bifidobacterium sp.]|uniref:hypothetical protein n=1 Tax=Bifidobacterium sp. TaxID=41200 RepID=UPI0039E937AB